MATRYQAKTVPTDRDVDAFIAAVPGDVRRRDAGTMRALMERVTGQPAVLWGTSLVGFGSYHYVYESGHEGDAGAVGFSPRATSTTVYFADGFDDYADDLGRLGPHSLGKSCLYLKDLAKVDLGVLEGMVRRSYEVTTTRTWPLSSGA